MAFLFGEQNPEDKKVFDKYNFDYALVSKIENINFTTKRAEFLL